MSQNAENNTNASVAGKVSFATKAGYVGTGVLIGLVVYPFVRKTLIKVQPKMDALLDQLTGKVENMAEGASDLMARAKEAMGQRKAKGHDHSHSSDEGQASGSGSA